MTDAIDEAVVRPSHYTRFEIEPIEFIMRNHLPYWLGNVVKYGLRAGHKKYDDLDLRGSEIRDLRKMIRYTEMRINQIEGKDQL